MLPSTFDSVETKTSWAVASVALVILAMSYGAAWVTVVALEDIASEVAGSRSVPALAGALAWLGSGIGGIIMSRIAERAGTRSTVIFGALMIGLGLLISTLGPPWPLWIGHGLFIGLIGMGSINAPLYIYVSRWFDRRRGSALALISSGTYVAGALWPPIFEQGIAHFGSATDDAVVCRHRNNYHLGRSRPFTFSATRGHSSGGGVHRGSQQIARAGMAAQCRLRAHAWRRHPVLHSHGDAAGTPDRFLQRYRYHSIDGRSDVVGAAGHRIPEPANLGAISDRIGGRATILIGSAWQAASMTAFRTTQNELGLFTVAAVFGLGFSGIIPAYVLAVRELFPASEASWRIPAILLFSGGGMAAGSWIAGLLYDHLGYYAPAFEVGIGSQHPQSADCQCTGRTKASPCICAQLASVLTVQRLP